MTLRSTTFSNMDKSEKVAAYFEEEHPFKQCIALLRELALKSNLEETYKWMFPTYMLNGKNVLSICKFNKHCGIWFFNGVFLTDTENVLENAQKGKTQAMRHWKFYSEDTIDLIKVSSYMNEAIENERKGIKLMPKKKGPVNITIPPELKQAFKKDSSLKHAFDLVTPYKQKEYCEYIATAKQEKTKQSRLAKIVPLISDGKGLNDMYR